MRFVYIVIAYLLAPVVLGTMALRGFRDRSHWEGFSQRLGLGAPVQGGPGIWVHAVSVGEVQASVPLVNPLLAKYPQVPLVVTTTAWTVDNDVITPTFKVKRNRIEDLYAKHYEAWENSGKTVLWQS